MDVKTIPLELAAEDTFYDIIMKGAHVFSKGKLAEVQHVSIDSTTAFRPEDPQIDLYASFSRKKPKYISVELEYDKEHNIADRALHDVLVNIPSSRYKLRARQILNMGNIEERLAREPARVLIDAPFGWGFADVSLPKEANWIDTGLLIGILDNLGLKYKQDDHLKVKSLKFRGTSLHNLISTYGFFAKNNFETELVLEMMPITVTLKNEKDKQTLKYSLYSFFGVGKDFSDGLQKMFERHLSFTGNGRPFSLSERFSELKSKEMKIDYK